MPCNPKPVPAAPVGRLIKMTRYFFILNNVRINGENSRIIRFYLLVNRDEKWNKKG